MSQVGQHHRLGIGLVGFRNDSHARQSRVNSGDQPYRTVWHRRAGRQPTEQTNRLHRQFIGDRRGRDILEPKFDLGSGSARADHRDSNGLAVDLLDDERVIQFVRREIDQVALFVHRNGAAQFDDLFGVNQSCVVTVDR